MAQALETRPTRGAGAGWRALGIFCAVAGTLGTLYLASVWAFADLSVFRYGPAAPESGPVRLARFNAALGLVLAYVCAALWLGQHWMRIDFEALRTTVEGSAADWAAWTRRVSRPEAGGMWRAALLGGVAGGGIDWIGAQTSYDTTGIWRGHVVWVWVLNPALFTAMGVLVWLSTRRASLFRDMGRRARVRLGEIRDLAPFARAGLRAALFWFLGTSLASLLLVDTDARALVLSILAVTTAVAVFSLLAPARGVHERLQNAKRAELAWLRDEIARGSDALRRRDAEGAAQLPALLAWEARVASAPEWPFDTVTWLRFALLLLVPLGSWLGGALVEHVVERWLGA